MLKIPKGLKKKKKGKKGKHKGDDDLFTPEELEEYKRQKALREQQEQQEAEAAGEEGAEAASSTGHHDHNDAAAAHDGAPEAAVAAPAEDEDRLQALLGGVDSILNKTQRDLERIKQTSFFQRKPTPSELDCKRAAGPPARPAAPTAAAASAAAGKRGDKRWVGFGDGQDDEDDEDEHLPPAEKSAAAPAAAAFEPENEHPHEDEEESEEEDEGDDIFDTSYIDVITSGEVKLAYIPDSPTEQPDDGDDPFDTTYAAKVIGNDEDIKRRQKLEKVSLGIAVDVLTGKAAPPSKPPPLPENAVAKRAVPRRAKPVDLLKLGSFDDSSAAPPESEAVDGGESKADVPKSLLDDDALLAIPEDLPPVGTPIIPPAAALEDTKQEDQGEEKHEEKQIDLSEFDVIAEKPAVAIPVSNLVLVAAALGGTPNPPQELDDDLEDEFAALAQESLQRKKEEEDEFEVDGDDPFDTTVASVVLGEPEEPLVPKATGSVDVLLAGPQASWSAFDEDEHEQPHLKPSRPPPPRPAPPQDVHADPFDTSFAQNILPGKTELKIIEKEILADHKEARILSHSDSDFDFNPREDEEPKQAQPQVSFYVTDPAGEIDNSPVIHRDLLGGSTSDLSSLGHDPLPAETPRTDQEEVQDVALHDDPFDTSAVEAVAAPGRTELRYLEKEILGDVSVNSVQARADDDDDFDPRAEEVKRAHRPDVLPGVQKSVAFALPSPAQDLLAGGEEGGAKFSKPLTPYYAEQAPAITAEVDPFDTSIATNLAPGKAELKVLESELVDGSAGIKASISDENFDPRAGTGSAAVVDQDLFKVEEDVGHRPLTPAVEEASEVDPFDTSIASNIAPGKTELKILESELISSDPQPSIKRTYTDPDFNPRDEPAPPDQPAADLLNDPAESEFGAKPLTPILGEHTEDAEDDIDPFDTSIAADLGPGKTELRILESELIGHQ